MVISKRTGVVLMALFVVVCTSGAAVCFMAAKSDVLFFDWLASATRAEVWLFMFGVIVSGVMVGRQFGGARS